MELLEKSKDSWDDLGTCIEQKKEVIIKAIYKPRLQKNKMKRPPKRLKSKVKYQLSTFMLSDKSCLFRSILLLSLTNSNNSVFNNLLIIIFLILKGFFYLSLSLCSYTYFSFTLYTEFQVCIEQMKVPVDFDWSEFKMC